MKFWEWFENDDGATHYEFDKEALELLAWHIALDIPLETALVLIAETQTKIRKVHNESVPRREDREGEKINPTGKPL